MINIRFATIKDIPRIMEFIKKHWDENHIFANNRELFEWQHRDGDNFNYVIGEDDSDGKIYGAVGFILMNHTEHPDISSTMLKSIKSSREFLGMDMGIFLTEQTKCRIHCSPGINKRTAGVLLEVMDSYMNKLNLYYRLNDLKSYSIAVVNNKNILPVKEGKGHLKEIFSFDEFDKIIDDEFLKTIKPYKDKVYLKHRYFKHPVYNYRYFAIDTVQNKIRSVLIMREVKKNNSKILKIIDYIGVDEELKEISYSIDELIKNEGYEYIDFYCYGISDDILKQAGFTLMQKDDINIIPNYFEPFEEKNIEIYFQSTDHDGIHMYRGDGDQDRPSIICIEQQ